MQNKSFTLIELLVVIAIIGLIASIVLVNVGGLQGKARLTKTLEFSQSLNNSLGAYMVGYWSFDDQANPTKDNSGFNNNGTITGATFSSDTPHAVIDRGTGRYALSFDGVDDYVNAGSGTSLNIVSAITIEAWIKSSAGGYRTVVSRGYNSVDGGYAIRITVDSEPIMAFFQVYNTAGTLGAAGAYNNISNGNWYYVVGTYDGTNVKFYVNGNLNSTAPLTGNIKINSLPLRIGRLSTGAASTEYYKGFIDEVRVYEKALTLGEIQQHYAEGLERHRDLAIK